VRSRSTTRPASHTTTRKEIRRHDPLRPESAAETPPACPTCGEHMVPLSYGLPTSETFEAAERGEVVLGGCLVYDDRPDFVCPTVIQDGEAQLEAGEMVRRRRRRAQPGATRRAPRRSTARADGCPPSAARQRPQVSSFEIEGEAEWCARCWRPRGAGHRPPVTAHFAVTCWLPGV
jgi:hypothetical protein